MVGKTAFRRVQLIGGYAKIEQDAVDLRNAPLREQLLHVEEVAADRREHFAEAGKPRRSRFDRGAVPIDPVKLSALGQLFQHSFGMAAAAERSVHKNAAALWFQQGNDCVPQDWNVVKAAHMPSPAR